MMPAYQPSPNAADTRAGVQSEFNRIAEQFEQPEVQFLQLQDTRVEPAKPRDGMIVYTSGAGWNPGGGQGFYGFYDGLWRKLD